MKALHRAILLSNTYRQSSDDRVSARRADAENRLLWDLGIPADFAELNVATSVGTFAGHAFRLDRTLSKRSAAGHAPLLTSISTDTEYPAAPSQC